MARSQFVSRRCCTRASLMRVCVSLEIALLTIMLLAFIGKLVIKRMVNEGIKEATLLDPYAPNSTWNRMVRNDRPGAPPDMLYVFLYNITNLPEVHEGAKPHLDEVGPYVYRKRRVKMNVEFDRNRQVSYNEYLYFEPGLGCDDGPAASTGAPANSTADPADGHGHARTFSRRDGAAAEHAAERAAGGDEALGSVGPDSLGPPRCARNDVITTLNLPLLGVLRTVDKSTAFKAFVEIAIHQFFEQKKESGTFEGLFMRRPVEELLFGYDDELISAVAHLVPSLQEKAFFKLIPNMTSPEDAFPLNTMSTRLIRRPPLDPPPAPPTPPHQGRTLTASPDTRPDLASTDVVQRAQHAALAEPQRPQGWLAWLAHVGHVVVVAPAHSIAAAINAWASPELPGWSYVEWQRRAAVTCWADGHEERVAGGSDALQFPPKLTAKEPIYVYVPELFRMARLNATDEVTVSGVRLLKYQPDDRVVAPDARFFTEIPGLMNVTACTAAGPSGRAADAAGPPVFMSMPHYCHVDPAVAAQTTGVSPCDVAAHDLWLGVEPITGITMAARKRLQVSSAFDARHSSFDRSLRPTILPIFWAEEAGEVGVAQAQQIRSGLYPAMRAISVLSSDAFWVTFGTAALALLCALSIITTCKPPPAHAEELACAAPLDEAPFAEAVGGRGRGAAANAAAAEAAANGAVSGSLSTSGAAPDTVLAAAAAADDVAAATSEAMAVPADDPAIVAAAATAVGQNIANSVRGHSGTVDSTQQAQQSPTARRAGPDDSAGDRGHAAPEGDGGQASPAARAADDAAAAEAAAVPWLLEAGWEGRGAAGFGAGPSHGGGAGGAPVPGSPTGSAMSAMTARSSRMGVRSHNVSLEPES
eukprot:jgi/Ulvmu1/12364/UM009_0010.1